MSVYILNEENKQLIMERFQELVSSPFKITFFRVINEEEKIIETLKEKDEYEEKGQLSLSSPINLPENSIKGMLLFGTFYNEKGTWYDSYYEGETFTFSQDKLIINKTNDEEFNLHVAIMKK